MTDWTAPPAPAPLIGDPATLQALLAVIGQRVALELNIADPDEVADAVAAACELVTAELDRPVPFPDDATVPAAVVLAICIVAADLWRRGGLAFGVIGVGETGAPITAGRDPLASVRHILIRFRRRWGVA